MNGEADPLVVAENDYLYGAGPVRLRVLHVHRDAPYRYDGEDWYRVRGVQLAHDGRELGRRDLLVRARRLPRPR